MFSRAAPRLLATQTTLAPMPQLSSAVNGVADRQVAQWSRPRAYEDAELERLIGQLTVENALPKIVLARLEASRYGS